jgi:hypothetical protein
MSGFSDSVSGIDTVQMDSVIDEVKALIDMANDTASLDTSGMTGFADSIEAMGVNGIDSFIAAFTDSIEKVKTAVQSMLNAAENVIKTKNIELKNLGTASATYWLSGFKVKYSESLTVGQMLANNVISGIQNSSTGFYTVGSNAGQGFVNGLSSKISAAASAGAALGKAAYEAAKKALDEHSPSKKMGEVGDFAGLGFVGTLMSYVAKAAQAGEDIGTSTLDGVSSTLNKASKIINLDDAFNDITDPVIKPIVDLENVRNSANSISKMFNDTIKVVSGNVEAASNTMDLRTTKSSVTDSQNEANEKTGNTYQFIQNNNSPKSLSRVEIYRQTKNQFTKFKQEVGI